MAVAQELAKTIFLQALELASQEEQLAFIHAQCGHDDDLRREVASLLQHAQRLDRFLASIPEANQVTLDLPVTEKPGAKVGPYKLLEQIGEGGMGVVFMAEQTEPVRRKVALKVIKPGMDTRQVVARFEAERQALAIMDHPNIAKVFDGGATDSGRPYFVMELVRGVPIVEYCDQYKLDVKSRLLLFIDVCRAVEHAHQKGIIHRDLKPRNVLVTRIDAASVPKVIDFGIAKATGGEIAGKTAVTGFKQLLGTPLYMSPEQAEMSNLDIDTRSDVYSLGAVLYELLTGHTPFDKQTMDAADFDELRRLIREFDPPRPSSRLSTLGAEKQSTVSALRGVDVRALSRRLHGELDWIVMKSLEKDRTRRYASAKDLARDVERHLHDQPVEACLVSALAVNRRVMGDEHHQTIVNLSNLASLYRAQGQLSKAEPLHLQVLEARRRILGEEHPDTIASMHYLAGLYQEQRRFELAEPLLLQELSILRRVLGGEHSRTLDCQFILARLYKEQNQYPKAESLLRELVDINRKLFGDASPQTAEAGSITESVGVFWLQKCLSRSSLPPTSPTKAAAAVRLRSAIGRHALRCAAPG